MANFQRTMADRLIPALVFGVLGLISLTRLLSNWTAYSTDFNALKFGHDVIGSMFVMLLAVLCFGRRTTVGERASFLPKVISLAGTCLPWVIFAQPVTINDWRMLAASDLLMIIGTAFTIYALGTLGRSFAIAPEARHLVVSGPYRFVRNPAYLAEFVTIAGGTLPFLSPLTFAIFVIFIVLQLRRIALEERVLSASFPEYLDYRRRTPALIPNLRLVRSAQNCCGWLGRSRMAVKLFSAQSAGAAD